MADKIIAMIPARMGSQRLAKKNIRKLAGIPLVSHAMRKCIKAGVFDEIWVNSESDTIGAIAKEEGLSFHKRPADLAGDDVTSEDYIYEFIKAHPCDYIFQVHSIAPLLTVETVREFVEATLGEKPGALFSVVVERTECVDFHYCAVNFTLAKKKNSQELIPVSLITWGITAWRTSTYIDKYEAGKCATYPGHLFAIPRMEGLAIKTEDDLKIAEVYLRGLADYSREVR